MLELLSYMGDIIHFYIDRMAAESYLPTALTRKSVVNLLKLIDYQMRGYVSSSADVTFTLSTPLIDDVTIAQGTLLKTVCDRAGSQVDDFSNNIYFETTSELVIPAGALERSVSVIQGKTTEYAELGISDGLANQRFTVPETPVAASSLRVYVDEGAGPQEWEIVDTMIENYGCDTVCMTFEDDQNNVHVQFGDNGQGKIPDPGASVLATYRVGGGEVGNVGSDTITIIESPLSYNGSPLTITVTNPLAASGGEDPQTIENARLEGPRSLRALYRAVTAEDFESLSGAFEGVAQAKAEVGEWRGSNKSACCQVSMFIVPVGGGMPSQQLKDDLLEYLDSRKVECTCVEIFDPYYQPIDLRGTIVVYNNFNVDDVRIAVEDHIAAYFDADDSPYTGFDKNVYVSDITAVIDNIDGVDHVDFTDITRHPAPTYVQWTGDAAFDDDEWVIGPDSKNERWTVTMINPTEFTVNGTVSGYQGNGTLDVPFTSTNGNIKFVLNAGSSGNLAGDFVEFKTSEKLANVIMDFGEFFTEGDTEFTFVVGGPGPRTRCV